MNRKLWYDREAAIWEDALPIGNGRIGAMVYSGIFSDKIQINEDTLWSGYPGKEKRLHSMEKIEEIRSRVKARDYITATEKASESMFGLSSDGYVPYGSLYIDLVTENKNVTDYRRELDLEEGIERCSYKVNDILIKKESFVSLKDDVLVIHVSCAAPRSFHIYQANSLEHRMYSEDNCMICEGRCPSALITDKGKQVIYDERESIHFCSAVKVMSDRIPWMGGNALWLEKTQEFTLIFSIATSFNGYQKMPVSEGREYQNRCREILKAASMYSYEELRQRNYEEYNKYFSRVQLKIDGENYDELTTDKRIQQVAEGTTDNGLITLLFDYSRYLTICSSMEGTQPSNLQGIWNYRIMPPWNSNYTMNINTQMNYWATETCNLPECHMPLFAMLKDFKEKGNVFGLSGWCSWHNSDLWRHNHEATKGCFWGYWPMGGAWAVRHIWEHYLHTRDVEFLKEYYPVMTSAAAFYNDWMYRNEEGKLTTCPSTSPENQFIYEGEACSICEGSAMDMEILYDLYDKVIKTGKVLGENVKQYEEVLEQLDTVKIGSDGRILEWGKEFREREPGHRHISHLYGIFPSDIWAGKEYDDAVRKTLEERLNNGGGHTGWSNAWIANVYARLGDGENVMKHIRNMFKRSIYSNMFDAHPPFQIDGNFGIASAICEALMQSHTGEIKLIPALPKEWERGEVHGFVTRTGKIVNFRWNHGIATYIEE